MNYSASVVDEVAPTGSKAPPSPRAAETAALGQTEKEIRRAESRRLAIAAQSGCIESFESLVGQFEKPLYHFLLTKTRNHHQAQDLLQDTFLITYRKLDRFNPSYPFSSWIYTIANRLAISHYRKQKPMVEEVEFAIETTASSEVIEQECDPLSMGACQTAAYEKPLHCPSAFLQRRHDHRPGGSDHEPESQLGESLATPRPKKNGPRAQTKTFHAMNKLYTAIAGIMLTSGLQPPAHGKEAEPNRYFAIVERNAFDLTDTPPSTQQKAPEPIKASDIKLTGIFLRNGVERAAIALIEKDKKNTKPTYLQLAVGEKQGTIEIKAIDKRTGRVTLLQLGSERELNFKDDAFKTAISKAPRTSSSKSSSSKSRSSSDAARRAAEIKAAIERKKAEKKAAKPKGGGKSAKVYKELDSKLKEAVKSGRISRDEYSQAWREIKGADGDNDRGDRKR